MKIITDKKKEIKKPFEIYERIWNEKKKQIIINIGIRVFLTSTRMEVKTFLWTINKKI